MSQRPDAVLLALSAVLVLGSRRSASAQGIGPPPGTELLLWLVLAVAALVVLVVSTALFFVGKKVLFKHRRPSAMEKFALFLSSIAMSCAAGVVVMLVFDIR